jgi:hypothetical protein
MQQIRSLKQQERNVSISNKFQGITSRLMILGTEKAYFMEQGKSQCGKEVHKVDFLL